MGNRALTVLGDALPIFLLLLLALPLRVQGFDDARVSKNFSYCLSCVNIEPTESVEQLFQNYLQELRIRAPRFHGHCRESVPTEHPGRRLVPIFFCPSGACVKIKGRLKGKTYVIRECWDRLWDQPLKPGWEGCTYLDAMAETEAHICVCRSNDMCNGSSTSPLGAGLLLVLLLSLPFFAGWW